jgi:ATP phosphoribosyltransferase
MFTLCLPTGRVLDEAVEVLQELDIPTAKLKERGRALVIQEEGFRFLLAKPMDVPVYVHYGIADLALAGSDVIWETGASLVELVDTGRGACRIVLAGPKKVANRFLGHESQVMGLRVATKYPRISEEYFADRGIQVEFVHLHGSIEMAPRLGLSDCIVDIVQTGSTLKANALSVIAEIAPVSLKFVSSRKSLQLAWDAIEEIIGKFPTSSRKAGEKNDETV